MTAPSTTRPLRALVAVLAWSSALLPAARLAAQADPVASEVAAAFALDPRLAQAAAPAPKAESRFLLDVTAFFERSELDEVTEDVIAANFSTGDSTKLGEVDLEDVERARAGVKARFGTEDIAGEFSLYGERFEPFDTFRLAGFTMAAVGTPRMETWGEVSLLLDYSVGFSLAGGSGDVAFVDSFGNTFEEDGAIVYLAETIRVGMGVEISGVQVVAGMIADYMQGTIDVDVDDNIDFDSSNVGGFASVGYRALHLPLYGKVSGYFGQYRGIGVELGVRF